MGCGGTGTFLSVAKELPLPRNSLPFSVINDSFGLNRITNETVPAVESIFAELRAMVLVVSAGADNPSGIDLDPRCVLVNGDCQGGGGPENDYLLGYGFSEW